MNLCAAGALLLPLQALLLAVRTCYNIHLMSRSEVNQTTAKASLTQVGGGAGRGWVGG